MRNEFILQLLIPSQMKRRSLRSKEKGFLRRLRPILKTFLESIWYLMSTELSSTTREGVSNVKDIW
jgi:hypothetical protein